MLYAFTNGPAHLQACTPLKHFSTLSLVRTREQPQGRTLQLLRRLMKQQSWHLMQPPAWPPARQRMTRALPAALQQRCSSP